MTVVLSTAKYREVGGRDALERASIWAGNAGTLFGLNAAYAACGAGIATTTTKVRSNAATAFTIGGQLFSKASTDNLWTLGGAGSATVVPASSFQKYALMIDDAGVATVQEATASQVSAAAVTWANVVAAAKANPQNLWAPIISLLSASRCVFTVITVATNGATQFTPGTTALNAAGITTTYQDGIDPSLMPILVNERGLIHGLSI